MSKIVTDLFDISELAHHGPENLFICILKIAGSFALLFVVPRSVDARHARGDGDHGRLRALAQLS